MRRIELMNIRSHKHYVFEPAASGITALQGENGRGKSTVLDSIAWVLYGNKPNGVSKASEIFRDDAELTDKAYARIDLEIDGRLYRFERRRVNKQGGIECEVFLLEKNNDGSDKLTNLAGPAVTHAESYIRKLLRMDEKGFLASVLVQQKQVDQLISASPRERGAVIEKLTGIAGVTLAVTEAKQELNSLRKAASMSSIDENALRELKDEEEASVEALTSLKNEQEVLKNKASELREEGLERKEKLEAVNALWERKNEIETRTVQLRTRKELKEEELERTNNEKEEERRNRVSSDLSYEDLETQLRDLDTRRRELEVTKSKAEDSRETLTSERKTLEKEFETLHEIEGDPEEISKELVTIDKQSEEAEVDLIEFKSELEQLENAIKIIAHGDSCPTCLQRVADGDIAVESLRKTVDGITKKQEKLAISLKDYEKQREEKTKLLSALQRKFEVEHRLSEIKKEVTTLKKAIDSSGSDLIVLSKELKSVQNLFDEAKRNKERDAAYRRLLEKAQKLMSEVEEIDFELMNLKKESSEMGAVSQREVNSLQKALDEVRSKHSTVSMDYTTKTGEIKVLVQRIEHLRKDILRHEEDIKKHNELIQSVTVAAASHEVISEFREDRIRNSIPVIEVYASDLLNRFTEGKFTRLSLNQKFEATVYLADGTPRAVGLLSGGELSAAAMALRLAISMLLNSGGAGQNLIVLDEVLVSQDANRSEQILSTLKEIFKGQVVLVAHNESVDSVADKIITLGAAEGD